MSTDTHKAGSKGKACDLDSGEGKLSAFQLYHLSKYAEIGMALSGEENVDRLLEMIIHQAREVTDADAGTLYLVNEDGNHLDFVILQNDTMQTRMGGTSGVPIELPPVPMYVDGKPNYANVSSYVALTGELVNIADVYESEEFDFTGPRKYDDATGYRSQSMLVIPMRNHENDVIGVMQLLNAQDISRQGCVCEFSHDKVALIASLASQAAAALTKTRLISDLKILFYSFIKSIANAIEEKSPYTGGHINRVVDLSMMIARKINDMEEGPFANVSFSDDELEELKLAAWLHDIGKIITPEWVVDKASKLQTIFDRLELVNCRFDLIASNMENDFLKRKLAAQAQGEDTDAIDAEMQRCLDELEEDRAFVISCNEPGEFMSDDRIERVRAIGCKNYCCNGREYTYLTEDEVENLCIRKGTLTTSERHVIENHATMTGKMLSELPFPKKLSKVPEYAASHHEKLDGSGYPHGVGGKELPLQARIMAVADIFEALTAKDRPYKRPMPLSQAIKILGFMKKDLHIDPDVHDLFLSSGLFRDYAEQELSAEQYDAVEVPPALKERRVLLAEGVPELIGECITKWGAEPDVAPAGECASILEQAYRDCRPYRLAFLPQGDAAHECVRRLASVEGFPMYSLVPLGGSAHEGVSFLPDELEESDLRALVFAVVEGRRYSEGVNPALCLMGKVRERGREQGEPRILIVDDSANTRMLIRYYLQDSPYACDFAENGRQAVEMFTASYYDMIVMGTHLPVMSGFNAAKGIRAWEKESGTTPVPIVALTVHYIPGEGRESLEAGFTDYLIRPVTKGNLLGIVEKYLPLEQGAG